MVIWKREEYSALSKMLECRIMIEVCLISACLCCSGLSQGASNKFPIAAAIKCPSMIQVPARISSMTYAELCFVFVRSVLELGVGQYSLYICHTLRWLALSTGMFFLVSQIVVSGDLLEDRFFIALFVLC